MCQTVKSYFLLVLQVLWLERNNLTHAPPIPVVSKEALVFATEYGNSNTGKVRKSEMLTWQKSNVHDPGEGTGREEGEQGPVPEKWSEASLAPCENPRPKLPSHA